MSAEGSFCTCADDGGDAARDFVMAFRTLVLLFTLSCGPPQWTSWVFTGIRCCCAKDRKAGYNHPKPNAGVRSQAQTMLSVRALCVRWRQRTVFNHPSRGAHAEPQTLRL